MGPATQPDPIGLAGGLNLYGYAGGDPISFGDPFGLCKVEVQFTTAGVVGNHATIVTTSPDNTRTYFSGGPSKKGPSSGGRASGSASGVGGASSQASESNSNSGNSSSPGSGRGAGANENSPYGSLTVGSGSYEEGKPEYQPAAKRSTVLDDKASCDKYNAKLRGAMSRINNAGIVYNPFTTNSNAAASYLLQEAGLLGVDKRDFPVIVLPGWNRRLF